MDSTPIQIDIAIIGGGIAGLWLLNRLLKQGYNAVLFESDALGDGQTVASQGMIHGGIKYALGGVLSGASEAIADMPEHWRRCLRGEGDVDLRQANILSDHFYLWSTSSMTSRIGSFFASKLTRGRVDKVSKAQRPPVFDNPQFNGKLYKLVDLVLDVPSLLSTLAANCPGRIFSIDWQRDSFLQNNQGAVESIKLCRDDRDYIIKTRAVALCAGAGNEALLKQLGASSPAMQRRPLKQVVVKHDNDFLLYAHCMGSNPSPRLTVSSHRSSDGKTIWYLGGDLATDGIKLDDGALIHKAKQELADLFPWLDFSRGEWATLSIDRAEPKQIALVKPDKAFVDIAHSCNNALVCWPTKLTLAPNMADEVCQQIQQLGIKPGTQTSNIEQLSLLGRPDVAMPCWETLFS